MHVVVSYTVVTCVDSLLSTVPFRCTNANKAELAVPIYGYASVCGATCVFTPAVLFTDLFVPFFLFFFFLVLLCQTKGAHNNCIVPCFCVQFIYRKSVVCVLEAVIIKASDICTL